MLVKLAIFKLRALVKVFSLLCRKMDAIHAFAREGEVENLLKCVDSGVSIDLKGICYFLDVFILIFKGMAIGTLNESSSTPKSITIVVKLSLKILEKVSLKIILESRRIFFFWSANTHIRIKIALVSDISVQSS